MAEILRPGKIEEILHQVSDYVSSRNVDVADYDDIAQECRAWLARNARRVEVIEGKYGERSPAVLLKALRDVAVVYCRDNLEQRVHPEALELTSGQARAAFAALPDKDRYVIEQVYLHGRTHGDLAEELGVDRTAVTHRYERALKKMRTHFLHLGDDAEEDGHWGPAPAATFTTSVGVDGERFDFRETSRPTRRDLDREVS